MLKFCVALGIVVEILLFFKKMLLDCARSDKKIKDCNGKPGPQATPNY